MKNKFLFYNLLIGIYSLTGCSSGTGENKKEEELKKTISVDTSLRGLVGVIEKNPPVQQGDYIVQYPNGIIKMRGYYRNGKRNGQWTSFFQNGNVQSEGFFKDGLRDGSAKVYYENGKIYYEGYYKEGREVGKWVFYDTSGVKVNEKDYSKPNS